MSFYYEQLGKSRERWAGDMRMGRRIEKKKLSVGPMKLGDPCEIPNRDILAWALQGGLEERQPVDQPCIKTALKATTVGEVIESEHRNEMSQGWILRNRYRCRDHKGSQIVHERGESPFRNVSSEWPPPLSFLVRNSYVLISYCYCNQLSQTQWLKTIQTYSLKFLGGQTSIIGLTKMRAVARPELLLWGYWRKSVPFFFPGFSRLPTFLW